MTVHGIGSANVMDERDGTRLMKLILVTNKRTRTPRRILRGRVRLNDSRRAANGRAIFGELEVTLDVQDGVDLRGEHL